MHPVATACIFFLFLLFLRVEPWNKLRIIKTRVLHIVRYTDLQCLFKCQAHQYTSSTHPFMVHICMVINWSPFSFCIHNLGMFFVPAGCLLQHSSYPWISQSNTTLNLDQKHMKQTVYIIFIFVPLQTFTWMIMCFWKCYMQFIIYGLFARMFARRYLSHKRFLDIWCMLRVNQWGGSL